MFTFVAKPKNQKNKYMKKLMSVAAALLLLISAARAQENSCCQSMTYKPYPYVFIGLQGGGQLTFSNYRNPKGAYLLGKQGSIVTPTAGASLGAMFSPEIGARLHVNGWKGRGGVKGWGVYDYNYLTSDADLMVNLVNLFSKKKCGAKKFGLYLIGGVGLTYVWDNDDFNALQAAGAPFEELAWKDYTLVHNFRAGLMAEANVCKHLGITLEVDANNLHDRFNSKRNGRGDWQLTAMLGLQIKFGFKKAKPAPVAPVPEPVVVVVPKPEPEPAPEPEPEPVVEEKKPEPVILLETREEIFFDINKSVIRASEMPKIEKLAAWLKAHPKAKVTNITGYADKGTGTAKINKRLSRERAAAVKAALIKLGIEESRIEAYSKGDTVQPFAENDSNRAVIAIAKEEQAD